MSMRSVSRPLAWVGTALGVVALAFSCSVLSCGGGQPEPSSPVAEPEKASDPATEPTESDPATEKTTVETPEPAEPAGPTEPYGKVLDINPHKDDPADRRAHVEFFNPTDKDCQFKGYTLKWGSSSKTMPLGNVRIPAGNSRERFLTVHPNDGDIDNLSTETATVELDVECQ